MTVTQMDLAALAADITTHLGVHFPAPAKEMPLRQVVALAEEGFEVEVELRTGTTETVGAELCDTVLTAYILAHYLTVDLDEAVNRLAPTVTAVPVVQAVGRTVGATRRYLGLARRPGTLDQVLTELAGIVLAARATAGAWGIDLEDAISRKVAVIYARGWKNTDPTAERAGQ